MNHLGEPLLIKICKILIKQNNEEEKRLKKYKMVNANIKLYNESLQKEIIGKNEKLEKMNKVKESIEKMKVNEDKDEGKYDCENKDGKSKIFICDFEGCSQSYNSKKNFAFDFTCHFIGELTCKQYGLAFKFQHVLRSHL